MINCSVNGCENRVQARDWCNMHYLRWRRTGSLEKRERTPHRRVNGEVDWLGMAKRVVSSHFSLPNYLFDDACSWAIYRGWLAFTRGEADLDDPNGYIYVAMRNGVKSFIKGELGENGEKSAVRLTLSLDIEAGEKGRSLHDILAEIPEPEPETNYSNIYLIEEMYRWIRQAPLATDERQIIYSILEDYTQGEIARKMGVSTSQVSKLKLRAIDKIRDYAFPQEVAA